MGNKESFTSTKPDGDASRRDITVNFTLPKPYSDQLRGKAKASQISPNKLARKYLVASLEESDEEHQLFELSVVAEEVGYLRHQVALFQNEIEGLRLALYLTTELLLVLLGGLAPEVAHKVMTEVLAEEENE
jgi:hypothetical protein